MTLPTFPSTAAIRRRGFTLIELMIAVAIVGILLRLALPAYNNSVKKSRRADAKTALLDFASREERFFATNNVYTSTATSLGYATGTTLTAAAPMPILTGSTAYYNLSVAVTTGPPAAFTVSAVPTAAQASDSCGTYTLTNAGVQDSSSHSPDCW
jgi:type IV pilus assembly protein PilE